MIFFKTFRRTSDQGTWRIGDKDPDDRARAHSRQADLLQCILVGKKAKIQVLGQWVTFSIKTDCRSWRPLTHQPFGKVSCDGTQPVVEQCYPRKFLVPPALGLDCFYPSGSIFVKNVRSIVNKAMGLQCWHNPGPTLTAARGPGKMNLLKRQTSTVKLVDHVLSRSYQDLSQSPLNIEWLNVYMHKLDDGWPESVEEQSLLF